MLGKIDIKTARISIEAVVDGVKLGVQEVSISLAVNAIPSITLVCAPSMIVPDPLKPKVYPSSMLDYYVELYRRFAKVAPGFQRKGSVDITIEYADGTKDRAEIKDWRLSSVGMSSVESTSAPSLSIILQHPVCLLTQVGSVYETAMSESDILSNSATAGATDILDIMSRVYSLVKNHIRYWPCINTFPAMFRSALDSGDYEIKKHLYFDGGPGVNGIFMAVAEAASMESRIAQAIARRVLPANGSSSTWDTLVGMSGTLLHSVMPIAGGYDELVSDRLKVEPTQPWKEPSLFFDADRFFATDLPGMDPMKIGGVMCDKPNAMTWFLSQGVCRNGNKQEEKAPAPSFEVMYCPFDKPTLANGRILKIAAPSVAEGAVGRDAVYGANIKDAKADGANVRRKCWNALELYCKAVYEIYTASMIRGNARMAVGFRDSKGTVIMPGNTCEFSSEGEPLYYGYITQVVHTMSSNGGGMTAIGMSYMRPDEDFKVDGETAIKSGSPNWAYGQKEET